MFLCICCVGDTLSFDDVYHVFALESISRGGNV